MSARVCAFCGLPVDLDQPGSVFLVIGSDRDPGRQELFAHTTCLAERLHPQTPFAFDQSD